MACVQHPGAHQHWNVDARGIGCGWRKAVLGLGWGRSLDQEGCFVVSAVESAFGGKSKDAGERWALGRRDEIQEASRRQRRESNNRKRMAA